MPIENWLMIKSIVQQYLRLYPTWKAEAEALKHPSATPNYNGMPSGTTVSRSTEQNALSELPEHKQKIVDAVRECLEETRCIPGNGSLRIKLITLVYFGRYRYALYAAARRIYISEATARRYNKDFVLLVAKKINLI